MTNESRPILWSLSYREAEALTELLTSATDPARIRDSHGPPVHFMDAQALLVRLRALVNPRGLGGAA